MAFLCFKALGEGVGRRQRRNTRREKSGKRGQFYDLKWHL